jgi:hypothetical protein
MVLLRQMRSLCCEEHQAIWKELAMGEEVVVDMDGHWGRATAPEWLSTTGVSTCIAVAVSDDACQLAWLVHSPSFGHDIKPLEEMLFEATVNRPLGLGLKVCVFGGAAADADCEAEAAMARRAVEDALARIAPSASLRVSWCRSADIDDSANIQVVFAVDSWTCELMRFDGERYKGN